MDEDKIIEESDEEEDNETESELEDNMQDDFTPMGSVIPMRAPVLESTPIDEPVQNLEEDMGHVHSSSSSTETEEPVYAEQAKSQGGDYEQISYDQPGGESMQRDREIAIRPSLQSQSIEPNHSVNLRQFQQQTMGSEISMADKEREYIEAKSLKGAGSKGIFGRERTF